MTTRWPIYRPDRTVQLIGDVHLAGMSSTRQGLLRAGLAKPLTPQVAATIQVGDATVEGTPEEDAVYLAYMDTLTKTSPLYQCLGNHDVKGDLRTPEQAAAALLMPARNYVADLGFIRLLVVFPGDGWGDPWNSGSIFSPASLAWLAAQAEAAGDQPCAVVCHFPIYETVMGDPITHKTSTDNGYYVATLDNTANSDNVLEVLGDLPNIRAWLNGHTHSSLPTEGFISTLDIGGRNVACINASGAVSVDKATNDSQYTYGPLHTIFPTFLEDRIEVRYRAHHGGGFWDVRTGTEKVTTIDA